MELEVRSEMDKVDDVMPGFRFHPTDEELVGYYLKRKVQQKSLPIDLIKQVDIYKHDPWDLPKLASTGEKEWYFYCPRDRKYRNSARPNRVTRAGFWKATGTDRPIYSSGGKCIGLKKSLVFYRGRAAKGMKTDWMMHEFRLPCMPSSDSTAAPPPPKKLSDRSFSATDSWAICRIFKKTNSLSMVQKALSHPWISELPGSMVADLLISNNQQFCSESNISNNQFSGNNNKQETIHQVPNNNANNTNFSDTIPAYKPIMNNNSSTVISKSQQIPVSNGDHLAENLMFCTLEPTGHTNPDFIGFEEPTLQQYSDGGFSISLPHHQDMQLQPNMNFQLNQCERTIEFPFNFPSNEAWKATLASWESLTPLPHY